MPLEELYRDALLEHNRRPRNLGVLPGATHRARGLDALCGDDIEFHLKLGAGGVIEQAAFTGQACAVTTAAASMLTDWLVGRRVEEFHAARETFSLMLSDPDGPDRPELGEFNHLKGVARFPARVRNAMLPWRTAAAALKGEPLAEN